MDNLFLQIGFAIQFIVVLVIYFHSASFYKSMSRMILQTLASISTTRAEVEFLVQLQKVQFKEKNHLTYHENVISDFLRAFNFENFTIKKEADGYYIDIYDYNGKRILTETELDYLHDDVDTTLKIAYFKSGEVKSSKIQIVPKDSNPKTE